ncbi:MAG TPA: adenylate/guanylate cyclase domain-containing protein [Acidimicrobiales bacterium]|nr:adenylate/guanylate cyclase domain-containing protein [Acidimicrobiales bacterium]
MIQLLVRLARLPEPLTVRSALHEDGFMAEARAKNLASPDDTLEFPGIKVAQVDVGDLTVGRIVTEPGWRWYTHVRPHVGGEWCEARHVGVVLSGRFGIVMRDGTTLEFRPDDVFEIPPGHDGYTIGNEPCVQIEWSGLRAFAGFRLAGTYNRALVTLMFTDLVDSTAMAKRIGDVAWRDLLSTHYEATRAALERHHGHEVNTTGDGLLATFDGPAAALRCASAIGRTAAREGLQVRASVHVGEVELVGTDVRGIAVHEAARILSVAAPDEILVSATTRALAGNSGFVFHDRGTHRLKGLQGEWELFACLDWDGSTTG